MTDTWWCEHAWLGDGVADDVRITVNDGLITSIDTGCAAGGKILRGMVIPGLANAHSHAFHRALRSRTQRGGGSFWTWRELMYDVAERLTPDTYLALARAAYAEMALAGITAVGEFHYLHHGSGGVPYADPNAMGQALVVAAADAGVRLTLLDTCYLTASVDGGALQGPQRRFGDGDADRWAHRVDALRADCKDQTPRVGRCGSAFRTCGAGAADGDGRVVGGRLRHPAAHPLQRAGRRGRAVSRHSRLHPHGTDA